MMQRSLRTGIDARCLAVLGAGLLAAVTSGLLAGRSPAIALAGAATIAIAIAMVKDLAIGIAIFTVASFGAVLSLGGAATAAKALGGLLVLAWMAALANQRNGDARALLRDHRGLVACGVGLVAWSILSAAWAQSPSTALLGASRYAQNLVLFPILYAGVRSLGHVRWVAGAFVGGALLAMLYGVATGSTVDSSRLVGALQDPNETATVLVAASVLALALGMGDQGSRLRRRIAFSAGVLALFGVAATASRGGVVALAATAVVAVLIAGRWRRQVAAAAAVGVVLVVGWFVLLAPTSSVSHITSAQSPRTTLWTVAGRTIAANPVVGVGNDNFQMVAKDYLLRPGATTNAEQIVTVPHVAHNIYLEVWADTGLIGLLLFVAIVVASLRAAWAAVTILENAGRRAEEILTRGLILAIVAILMAGFFVSDQYSKQLFLLLALACATLGTVRTQLPGSRPGTQEAA
jgi:putative inorganic carbon (HCO3(-)) transporter